MNKASAKYYLWVLLPVFLFCSCNEYSHYPKWILGEWVSEGDAKGYYFINKDSCEVRPGYIDYDPFPHFQKYYGSTTTYQRSKDKLRIFNLEYNSWEEGEIVFLSPSTMILYWTGEFPCQIEYKKAQYSMDSENLFDQIVINDLFYKHRTFSLDSSGIFLYLGYSSLDGEKSGFYTSDKGKQVFKQIERVFREANSKSAFIDTFPAEPDSIVSWGIPTITFIKNNQMATVNGPEWILDNCDGDRVLYCPEYFSKEFEWAYRQSLFLEQQMPVQQFVVPELWSRSQDYDFFWEYLRYAFGFRENNKKYGLRLYDSEYFYLWTQILKAKQVHVDFTPRYTLDNRAQTDGRYYRYKTERGDTVTLDLGFNFIERNNLAD